MSDARDVIARTVIQHRADKAGGCFSDEDPESVDDCLASRCPCVRASNALTDAILAALAAAGLAVVPREPTQEMLNAAECAGIVELGFDDITRAEWRAMLAAAEGRRDG